MKVRYQDTPEAPPYSPEDDYIVVVIGCEQGFTPKGDEKVELKVRIESTGSHIYETLSDKAQWKIDSFIRACFDVKKGEDVELTEGNVCGRRGWAHVIVDEYQGKKRNKIQRWLAKEKLPRDETLIPKLVGSEPPPLDDRAPWPEGTTEKAPF